MPVNFAAVRWSDRSVAARPLRAVPPAAPANDDGDAVELDESLSAALRHFALHGLNAAQAACTGAEAAWRRGDRPVADNWLAICRMFDKRLAADLEKRIACQTPARP
jgi:hypothetical protein